MSDNESLHFVSSIDLQGLRADVAKIEQSLKGITATAGSEAKKLDDTYSNLTKMVAGYFTVAFGAQLANSIVEVRGQFQQLDIAFTTMLGSKEKAAKLMEQTVTLAAKTPYSLLEIAQVEKGLIAFGEDASTVADTMTRLGNIASGTGANIGELGAAYGKVMSKGKMQAEELNQFTERGVPIVAELAKMYGITSGEVYKLVEQGKVGFPELQQVIKNVTSEGAMFYNLMEKQSATLTGKISNLGDAIDNMYNDMASGNDELIGGGIDGLTSLVHNYEEVLKILEVLVITYGSYKAAIILSSVAQKTLLTLTMAKEYLVMAKNVGFAATNQMMFNKAVLANPYAVAIGGIVGLIAILSIYGNKAKETSESQKLLEGISKSVSSQVEQESVVLDVYKRRLAETKPESKERIRLVAELNQKYPELLRNINAENATVGELNAVFSTYIMNLEKTIRLKTLESELSKNISDREDNERKFREKEIDSNERYAVEQKLNERRNTLVEEIKYQKDVNDYNKETADLLKEKERLQTELNDKPLIAKSFKVQTFEEFKKEQKTLELAMEGSGKPIVNSLVTIEEAYQKYVAGFDKSTSDYEGKITRFNELDGLIEKAKKGGSSVVTTITEKSKKTFEDQLSARKKQYEAYYNAVDLINEQFANKQFSDLIANGKTYTEYLNGEISKLESKKSRGTLTKDEGTKLVTLKVAYREETGRKTELDTLKEELDVKKESYDGDLVAYKQYLDEKEALLFGTNKEDQLKAVHDAQKANDKEIASNLKELTKKYASFEQQKKEITDRYAKERLTLINAGKTEEIAQLDKAEKEELKTLNANHVKETASYQYLFENIDKLSVSALQKRIERLKQDLALTVTTAEERLAIEKALAEASDALVSKAPLAALRELDIRARDLRSKINAAKTDAEKAPLQAELDGVTQKQGATMASVFGNVASHLNEAKELAGLFNDELADTVETAAQMAGAFAQIASGNYIGGIISAVVALASANKKWQQAQDAKVQRAQQDRQQKANELISEANKLYSEQLDLLGRIRGVNVYSQLVDTKDALLDSLTEANKAVEDLYIKNRGDSYTKWDWERTGWASVGYTKQTKYHDYSMGGLNTSLKSAMEDPTFDKVKAAKEEIQKIKDLIKDGTIFGDTDALKAQLDNYNELLKKAEELVEQRTQLLTGSSSDSMVEALASGFEDGIYTAEEFTNNFEGLMKKAILNSLKMNYLTGPMKDWTDKFTEYMSGEGKNKGVLTEAEAADLKARMQKIKDDAAAGLEAINQAGIDLLGDAGSKAEGLSGAIKGMSQDSADLMAGQLGAMRIHLADIATSVTGAFNADLKDAWKTPANVLGGGIVTMNDNLVLMRDTAFKANEYLAQIEVNTRKLGNIEALLGGKTTTPPKPYGYDKGFREDRISGR